MGVLPGCRVPFLQATRVRLKVMGNTINVEVDARNSGRWRRCATLSHVDMPREWATRSSVGMVAKTSKVIQSFVKNEEALL